MYGAPAPRAWRIATNEGVFWLAEAGNAARLIRLPLPGGGATSEPPHVDGEWSALEALADTAEAEATGRWAVAAGPWPPIPSRVTSPTPGRDSDSLSEPSARQAPRRVPVAAVLVPGRSVGTRHATESR